MAVALVRWIICLWLLSTALIGHAAPAVYMINFSPTGSPQTPTSGSFVYDSVLQQFSDFTVQQGGRIFDLTEGANDPSSGGYVVTPVCGPFTNSPAISFQLMNHSLPGCDQYRWLVLTNGDLKRVDFETSSSITGGQDGAVFGGGDGAFISEQQFSGGFSITPSVAIPEPETVSVIVIGLVIICCCRFRSYARITRHGLDRSARTNGGFLPFLPMAGVG
jgi:hypothetical protein